MSTVTAERTVLKLTMYLSEEEGEALTALLARTSAHDYAEMGITEDQVALLLKLYNGMDEAMT